MKKLYSLLLLLFSLASVSAFSASVVIKGNVKNDAGLPIANIRVVISTDTILNPVACRFTHTVFTNQNGFYSDTFNCSESLKRLRISVINCDGKVLTQLPEVPLTNIIEKNFVVCTVPVAAIFCKPEFTATPALYNQREIVFNSSASITAPGDVIVSRTWKFGDGTTLPGNVISPTHTYLQDGSYTVCLKTVTASGCEKELYKPVEIRLTECKANFTYEQTATGTKFNSVSSSTATGDSVVERSWQFGDGGNLTGNIKDPLHKFAQPGLYNISLTIKTSRGCRSTIYKEIIVTEHVSQCVPHFTVERIGPKKFRFNSTMSWVPVGDSIKQRKWNLGDGSAITAADAISIEKEFTRPGNYTVCLKIITLKGCENNFCIPVKVEDGPATQISDQKVKIISLYPTPVREQATTVVYSALNNLTAEVAVYDIYGVKKWGVTKVFLQGENITVIPAGNFSKGPYFFRITTMYGVTSRQFYKM